MAILVILMSSYGLCPELCGGKAFKALTMVECMTKRAFLSLR